VSLNIFLPDSSDTKRFIVESKRIQSQCMLAASSRKSRSIDSSAKPDKRSYDIADVFNLRDGRSRKWFIEIAVREFRLKS
jgi:hypothetical protein